MTAWRNRDELEFQKKLKEVDAAHQEDN